jgi:hypothetical protein
MSTVYIVSLGASFVRYVDYEDGMLDELYTTTDINKAHDFKSEAMARKIAALLREAEAGRWSKSRKKVQSLTVTTNAPTSPPTGSMAHGKK